MRLAVQCKRNVRVGNLFLFRAKGAADYSCARMTLASLSCTDWELLLLQIHGVYGNSRNNVVRSSSKALGSLRSQDSPYVNH